MGSFWTLNIAHVISNFSDLVVPYQSLSSLIPHKMSPNSAPKSRRHKKRKSRTTGSCFSSAADKVGI